MTPLSMASMKGHLEIVRALLDAKAGANKADNDGWTPLDEAVNGGHDEVADLLRDFGGVEGVIGGHDEGSDDEELQSAALSL